MRFYRFTKFPQKDGTMGGRTQFYGNAMTGTRDGEIGVEVMFI